MSELKVSMPSKSNNAAIDNYYFKKVRKEFHCKKGWLTFPVSKSTTSAESSHTNFREFIYLSKLADGSLVVFIDEYAKHTSIWYLGFGDYENVSKFYARYKPTIKIQEKQ